MAASERCAECDGVPIQGRHCLAHLTPAEWNAEIERLRGGERLDASRVVISPELLGSLLRDLSPGMARPRLPSVHFAGAHFSGDVRFNTAQFAGDAFFGEARFSGDTSFAGAEFSGEAFFGDAQFAGYTSFGGALGGAQFSRGASFYGAEFSDNAGFEGAQFSGAATFGRTRFSGDAHFRKARFSGDAYFGRTRFSGQAYFGNAQFSGAASFDDARFSSDASFLRAQFCRKAGFVDAQFAAHADFVAAQFSADASFLQAQFSGDADFVDARFSGDGDFRWARFSDYASFGGARFSGGARFLKAQFSGDVDFGPMTVARTLDCDGAVFDGEARVHMSGAALTCRGTRFRGRAELGVRWAEVALDDATFIGRSRLVGVRPFAGLDDGAVRAARADAFYADRARHAEQRLDVQDRPRLLSLRGASVENLALGNVDLRACRFFGAHGLDALRIEADCEFAAPPGSWRTRRRTLAEEHDWRADRRNPAPTPDRTPPSAGPASEEGNHRPTAPEPSPWLPPECQPAAWLERDSATEILDPRRIASVYRALRKAFEDRKDEPGAGDFYYGEMEMRRQPAPRSARAEWRFTRDRGERLILTLYWLVSGYGMRASRALGFLALTVAVGALLLAQGGFVGRGPAGGSVVFALESSISLLRAPSAPLTAYGEYVQIALRLLGPLFLGLALLALRGRVKR